MRTWDLTMGLDGSYGSSLFVQLATAIADDIRSGRLKPGDPLPGTRALATRLGVHRNTVIAGFQELAAQGLVAARWGAGTFVTEAPPTLHAPAPVAAPAPSYMVAPPIAMPPSTLTWSPSTYARDAMGVVSARRHDTRPHPRTGCGSKLWATARTR